MMKAHGLTLLIGPAELRRALLAVEMLCWKLDPSSTWSFEAIASDETAFEVKRKALRSLGREKVVFAFSPIKSLDVARVVFALLDSGHVVWLESVSPCEQSAKDDFRYLLNKSFTDEVLQSMSSDSLSLFWELMHGESVVSTNDVHLFDPVKNPALRSRMHRETEVVMDLNV